MIEDERTDNRDRLLKYYTKLLALKGINLDQSQNKVLNSLVNNLTEDSAKKRISDIDKQRLNRLMAYANSFNKLTKKEEFTVNALLEVVDAASEDPEQESVMINGNKYLYEKDSLDINKYKEKLYAIGNKQKGNTWSIYIDDEGELVIF